MIDFISKVDFPNKRGGLYLFKGKYITLKNEEVFGVIAFRVFNCKEDYLSFTTADGGGFQYHRKKSNGFIDPVFIEGEFFEINGGL